MLNRSINLLAAVAAMSLAGVMLLNYPLGSLVPSIAFLVYASLIFYRPSLSFILLPAILPVIGFAPWTGWITFEELDLLVLATAVGGYARFAFEGKPSSAPQTPLLMITLAILMSISILVSMSRGFADAGGFVFGWYQGYDGPMNSIRIGKSFFLALSLLPILIRLQNAAESDVSHNLGVGIAIGLAMASIASLWERLAFTELLNFSSDYRTTALFWEMHVGGAALDGLLLLTTPFCIWALRKSRSHAELGISLALLLLAGYVSLTTFSRGVYLALMLCVPLLAWQTRRQTQLVQKSQEMHGWGFFPWMTSLVSLGVIVQLIFPSGGYRALVAFLGVVMVSLSMPSILRKISFDRLVVGSFAGLFVGGILALSVSFLPKGPYLLYPIPFLLTLLCLHWSKDGENKSIEAVCVASFVCLGLAAASIAYYWGGINALLNMCAPLSIVLLMLTWSAFSRQPLWPETLRWRGSFVVYAVGVSAVVTVFAGGAYMGDRFSATSKDFEGRLSHWWQGLFMLQSPQDLVLGKGLGRFPANYYFAAPSSDFPGTYRIIEENGNSFISLVGPRHPLSFGYILRISQRLDFDSLGPFKVAFKARAKANAQIHLEVCEKHLLYSGTCAIGYVTIKPTNGLWQPHEIRLSGPILSGSPWYAPRFKMFSFGIGNGGGAAELDDLMLISSQGVNLLENSGFANNMQRWFFTSERDHLPWHVKNLLLNVLFDQGALGLLAFMLLTAGALWRLNLGRARYHELAPYLSAGIIGFLVVGMFDSLTDVPRLAFLYYLLILYALSIGTFVEQQAKPSAEKRLPETHAC